LNCMYIGPRGLMDRRSPDRIEKQARDLLAGREPSRRSPSRVTTVEAERAAMAISCVHCA